MEAASDAQLVREEVALAAARAEAAEQASWLWVPEWFWSTAVEVEAATRAAEAAVAATLGKADEETPARGDIFFAIGNFHAGEYEMLVRSAPHPPIYFGRAREGSPPSRLAAPSAATTINGALVAIDEAPYMSAGPDLGGRACGAL